VLKAGSHAVDSIALNRRDPDGPVDESLTVLLVDDPEPFRPPIAAIVNVACHPTVLTGANLVFSADYPGYAVRAITQSFPGTDVLVFNGACGDVNPVWIEQRHEEAERLGVIVGSAAARVIAELRPLGHGQRSHNIRWDEYPEKPVAGTLVEDVHLRVASAEAPLPARAYLSRDEYESTLRDLHERVDAGPDLHARREAMAQITRLRTEAQLADVQSGRGARPLRAEVMAVGFAPGVALLGLPGEFFVETVASIRQAAGLQYLPVACYANHYAGYVVPPSQWDLGGYETGIAFVAPEAEGVVRSAAAEVLREVSGGA
jgi:hypothetical protein